jgi:hypothetical protein
LQRRVLPLAASATLVLLATIAPFGALASAQTFPRWCLVCGGLWMTDAISNIALFVPLGISLALRGTRLRAVFLLTLGLTVFVEVMQSLGLPPGRSAALADVLANTVGGLLGWAVIHSRRWLFPASWRVAVRLCWAWTVGVVVIFIVTSAALGPRADQPSDSVRFTGSPFRHTPGRPWYGGLIDSAGVNGYRTRHIGTGPIIVKASAEPVWSYATVSLRGREPERFQVPMLFVHTPGDSSPTLMLAQHGDDAQLVVTRRAWDWGLNLPALTLPGVFRRRTTADPRVLRITAEASTHALRISAEGDHEGARWVTRPLVPTLGWTMIQSLISIDSPVAFVARYGWLATLMLPIGWWGAQAGPRRWLVMVIAATWLATGAYACVRYLGVSPVPASDWIAMAVLAELGAFVSGRMAGRRRAVTPVAVRV